MNRLTQLFHKLGLSKENGLFLLTDADSWVHKFPYRISRILKEIIKPTAFFCIYGDGKSSQNHPVPFNQSFILFFNDPTFEQEEEIHKQIINFGLAQAVFINRRSTLDLFHGNEFTLGEIKQLKKIKGGSSIDGFGDFSFVNILLGNSLKAVGEKRNLIDEYLLKNITDARRILVAKNGLKLPPKVANRLIGRLLFVSYLIDRDVTFSDQNIVNGSTKSERKQNFRQLIRNKNQLYSFFAYLNDKYNGDMFPLYEEYSGEITYDETKHVNDTHLSVLYHLFNCSELFSGQSYNEYIVQPSLFDLYDFEIIPVELISSIYENFIGNEFENEKLNLSKQKSIKAYYTPSYLVDYVLSQTVTPFLEDPQKNDSNCKVLDPACGSGIFLVETLRKIIEKELFISNKNSITDTQLWKLIKTNIYGIDIDSDAIDISIFSLYITILDYKQPAEIEKFKFRKLKDENLFGGIEADFFNLRHPFNETINKLDFIIGNPPWGQVSESVYLNYIETRNKFENIDKDTTKKLKLQIGDKEICQAFLIRTSDFASSDKNLKCCFIVSSKVLYNTESSSKAFRNYFLNKFHVEQIVELSPVNNKLRGGNHVFDNARQPAAIITFRPEITDNPTSENILQHITVKPNRFFLYYKTIVIEKHDVKNIKQEYFMENKNGHDWLWKVLVHGNALDIHFIKRLKDTFISAREYFDELGFETNGGLKKADGTNKYDTTHIINYDYLDAMSEFKPFLLAPKLKWKDQIQNENIKEGKVGYLPDERFFKGKKLLLKKGLVLQPDKSEHYFGAVTAFSDKNICFSSTVCSIVPKSESNFADTFLPTLSGLFNSRLFTYFLLNTSSSAGIERTRIHFKEFFSFPVALNDKIGELANSITNMPEEYGSSNFSKTKAAIEKVIQDSYQINDIELSLIDYSINVSIPILLRDEDSAIFKKLELAKESDKKNINSYANIVKGYFDKRFQKIGKQIEHEVVYTDYFIRINFHTIIGIAKEREIRKTKDDDLEILLGDLGVYEVCRDLYFQQDVRGFTGSSFYIIKPNERKLWHTAVAHLDALEIHAEITKAENKLTKSKVSI